MIVDEKEGKIVSIECYDCAVSTGSCKHSVAFLMWVRSEEPLSTEIKKMEKIKLAHVGTNFKYITTEDLSIVKIQQVMHTALQNDFLSQFLQGATK